MIGTQWAQRIELSMLFGTRNQMQDVQMVRICIAVPVVHPPNDSENLNSGFCRSLGEDKRNQSFQHRSSSSAAFTYLRQESNELRPSLFVLRSFRDGGAWIRCWRLIKRTFLFESLRSDRTRTRGARLGLTWETSPAKLSTTSCLVKV